MLIILNYRGTDEKSGKSEERLDIRTQTSHWQIVFLRYRLFAGLQGAEERKTEKYFCLHIVEMKRYDFILTQTGEPILSAINNNLFRSQTFDCMTGRKREGGGNVRRGRWSNRINFFLFLFFYFFFWIINALFHAC